MLSYCYTRNRCLLIFEKKKKNSDRSIGITSRSRLRRPSITSKFHRISFMNINYHRLATVDSRGTFKYFSVFDQSTWKRRLFPIDPIRNPRSRRQGTENAFTGDQSLRFPTIDDDTTTYPSCACVRHTRTHTRTFRVDIMCEGVYPKRIRGTANTQVAIEPILSKYHLKQVGEIRDAVVTGGG